LGISLVEISIGRYPIPAPSAKEYAKMFDVPVEEVKLRYPIPELLVDDDGNPPKRMAIFELLDYIVNKVKTFL
jgi:hypothetical protein